MDKEPEILESNEKLCYAVTKPTSLELNTFISLIKDLEIDKIEQFLSLKHKEDEMNARKEFDFHFSELQKNYKAAIKDKSVLSRDGSRVLYKFCPLENILRVYAPIITEHGFSFRWKEEMLESGIKRVWCYAMGYGHTESCYVDIPLQNASDFVNGIQRRGEALSYGKRYSFMNLFGVVIDGEDSDAAIPDDTENLIVDLQVMIELMDSAGRPRLGADSVKMILNELAKEEKDFKKLRNYWQRAKAKLAKVEAASHEKRPS